MTVGCLLTAVQQGVAGAGEPVPDSGGTGGGGGGGRHGPLPPPDHCAAQRPASLHPPGP